MCFGTGEKSKTSGGNKNFTPPVHACDSTGNPVTVSFGQGKHTGETLIADGHASSMDKFYGSKGAKLHDHFGPRGNNGDRGKYSG